MGYKFAKLEKAVSKVKEFASYHKSYQNAVSQARADYRGQRLHEEEKKLYDALQAQYSDTASAVSECLADLEQIKQARAEKALFAEPSTDFRFLSLPVVLSKEQVIKLYERNSKDALFCQALNQYAEKHFPAEKLMFAPDPDGVTAACSKIAGVLKPFSHLRGTTEADIASVVDDIEWNLAGYEDTLSEADSVISAEV